MIFCISSGKFTSSRHKLSEKNICIPQGQRQVQSIGKRALYIYIYFYVCLCYIVHV